MKICFSLPMPMDRLIEKTRVEPITIELYLLGLVIISRTSQYSRAYYHNIPKLEDVTAVFTDMLKVTPQAPLNCGVSSINVPHMQWALQKAKILLDT
jgi:hypothetical protein